MNAAALDWFELLRNAVDEHPRGKAGVADDLDISRTAVSLVLAGTYPANTDKIATRVRDRYDRIACPHLVESIAPDVCRSYALRPAPTNSPRDMRHWRACQNCPRKPEERRRVGAST